ncbi:hypothetical protein DICPUDRAFT_51698 [Dictyostelium purpureum]|uniref:SLC26A/SulP transporter domain-containing protein n=1 Tax=Dictyostelium purpureum TaxID=5786 RepID=F1A522_DICPU|nr:uncharacterized protein DICPUDRAFT_51698 [Dictyostelium purpureum]EGC28709.1 hypothetical protein DICPUDRAFT_51698 [Dictyostelium purpureum]|eukprot:XP_003294766.1 hypothetical protein DICPUDRAFT_51698 [Dictyostelium purpureum]
MDNEDSGKWYGYYKKYNIKGWKKTIKSQITPTSGDINAVFSVTLDNLANFASLSGILIFGFGMPADLVTDYFIPGPAFAVMIGSIALSIYAIILEHKNDHKTTSFLTAIPIGLDSPSTIGLPLLVIGPAFTQAIKNGLSRDDATREAWLVGCCTVFLIGLFKLLLTLLTFVHRQFHPVGKAAALAGIALALLGLNEFLYIIAEPVVGLVSLWIMLLILMHRVNKNGTVLGVNLPFNLSAVLVSAVIGTSLYYFMAGVGISVEPMPSKESIVGGYRLGYPHPANVFKAFSSAIKQHISIAIPYAILVNIGSLTVSDTAISIGQTYNTRFILAIDSITTIIGSLFGSSIQTTPYLGHTVFHTKFKARSGYSVISGLVIGLGGFFGYLSFLLKVLPKPAIMPIFIFISFEICHDTFHNSKGIEPHHSPAIIWAFFPALFQFANIIIGQISPVLNSAVIDKELVKTTLNITSDSLVSSIGNIMIMAHGFICTSLFWGTALAYIIDNKLKKASIFLACCGVLTFFGIIHSVNPNGEVYVPWHSGSKIPYHWTAAYFLISLITLLISFLKTHPVHFDDNHNNKNTTNDLIDETKEEAKDQENPYSNTPGKEYSIENNEKIIS